MYHVRDRINICLNFKALNYRGG